MTAAMPAQRGAATSSRLPPLHNGDALTRAEFERRYNAMGEGVKAELIEGIVYMASPGTETFHGAPHFRLVLWLGTYTINTPGVIGGDNTTVHLDMDNEPQPDAYLRIQPESGGRTRLNASGYIEGAPELVAEVAASSAAYDLHTKLNAYRRNGVNEYLVWRVYDAAFDWFILRDGRYEPLPPGADGILRSQTFPGLWLDPAALLRSDMPAALAVLQQGVASPEHVQFVAKLGVRPA